MAVPKKRTGHSAQGHRRSNWKATKPATTKCPNCGATVLTHTVCTACGTYKGKPVSLKDKNQETAAAVKEVKKSEPEKTPEVVEEVSAKKTTAKKSTAKKTSDSKPAAKKTRTKKAEKTEE